MYKTSDERRSVSIRCQTECVERNKVISCRMVHSYQNVPRCSSVTIYVHYRRTGKLALQLYCIPVGRSILFRL